MMAEAIKSTMNQMSPWVSFRLCAYVIYTTSSSSKQQTYNRETTACPKHGNQATALTTINPDPAFFRLQRNIYSGRIHQPKQSIPRERKGSTAGSYCESMLKHEGDRRLTRKSPPRHQNLMTFALTPPVARQ